LNKSEFVMFFFNFCFKHAEKERNDGECWWCGLLLLWLTLDQCLLLWLLMQKKWLKKHRKHHEIPLFMNTIFKIEGSIDCCLTIATATVTICFPVSTLLLIIYEHTVIACVLIWLNLNYTRIHSLVDWYLITAIDCFISFYACIVFYFVVILYFCLSYK